MVELITDRTQQHVDLLKALQKIGWDNLNSEQREQWYGEAAKGAYNHTDLNRVESAVAELAEILGIELTTKTDWGVWDLPTHSDMKRYLDNVEVIKNAVWGGANLPHVPYHANGLTYEDANTIENILLTSGRRLESIPRCGEIFIGEV
jgi:hypothetical protein